VSGLQKSLRYLGPEDSRLNLAENPLNHLPNLKTHEGNIPGGGKVAKEQYCQSGSEWDRSNMSEKLESSEG